MTEKTVFETLNDIDVSSFTEDLEKGYGDKKKVYTYLSWANAWSAVKKRYPNIQYEIKKFNNLPYVYDELTGYMVYTTVTIDDVTHEMWLPVLDSSHRPMKSHPYEITFKKGNTVRVDSASMFDINKTIMRCLTKNLAMHGLGLYLYAGEDLPETKKEEIVQEQNDKQTLTSYAVKLKKLGVNLQQFYEHIAKEEGVAEIKEVPKHKVLGYMKTELLNREKGESEFEPVREIQQQVEVAKEW